MMRFFIESTFCMGILYIFYHCILRNQKMFIFNRFFLIFSLIFSFIVPFIDIPIYSTLPINRTFNTVTISTVQFIQRDSFLGKGSLHITSLTILIALFISISFILFIRFVSNIFKIIQKINESKKVNYNKLILVLTVQKVVPHSFLHYVFINKADFENNLIEKELLLHEEVHCMQYHSIDIILIQIINIFFWFNPIINLYKKSILLNHEYYADDKVLIDIELTNYQQILLSILIRSNSNELVSGFRNSFIKNRLDMMTKSYPLHNAILRKFSAIALFLIMLITLTCTKEPQTINCKSTYENEWWSPILKKHNAVINGFNNFEKVFEMGSTNSINNRIVTLENAFFLLKPLGDDYIIIRSPLAHHDLDKNIISAGEGIIETYSLKSKDIIPLNTYSFDHLEYRLNDDRAIVVARNLEAKVNTKSESHNK